VSNKRLRPSGLCGAMTTKQERLIGMLLFAATPLILLWYVDYDHWCIVRFKYCAEYSVVDNFLDSFVYQLAYRTPGNMYDNINRLNETIHPDFWWAATQVVPCIVAWRIRGTLGLLTRRFADVIRKIYAAV
jgi:hypothetical protein